MTRLPGLKLSEEEERVLAEIDKRSFGCPRIPHDDDYHVSHMLKTLFMGMSYVSLSEEEERLIEKVDDWLDGVWAGLYPPEDLWIEVEDWLYDEMKMNIYNYDNKIVKRATMKFVKVDGEWTLYIQEVRGR